MREITHIVIHTSATPPGKWFDAEDIRRWHKARGWSDIGYHFVILLNGKIELGRMLDVPGAHVRDHNMNTIGVCYIGGGNGEDTRTYEQKKSLMYLLKTLRLIFPDADIVGHRDFPGVTKTCPNFDAKTEYKFIDLMDL